MKLRFIPILATASLLAACGSERSGEFTTEDGESGEYTIDTESGETTARIETEDGVATLRSGADVPVDLPNGFTIYPGAKIITNTVVDSAQGSGNMVLMETDASPDNVIAHYRKQAEAAGIEIQMELTVNDGKMIGGEAPGGGVFSLNASNDGEGPTSAQLMIGSQ